MKWLGPVGRATLLHLGGQLAAWVCIWVVASIKFWNDFSYNIWVDPFYMWPLVAATLITAIAIPFSRRRWAGVWQSTSVIVEQPPHLVIRKMESVLTEGGVAFGSIRPPKRMSKLDFNWDEIYQLDTAGLKMHVTGSSMPVTMTDCSEESSPEPAGAGPVRVPVRTRMAVRPRLAGAPPVAWQRPRCAAATYLCSPFSDGACPLSLDWLAFGLQHYATLREELLAPQVQLADRHSLLSDASAVTYAATEAARRYPHSPGGIALLRHGSLPPSPRLQTPPLRQPISLHHGWQATLGH